MVKEPSKKEDEKNRAFFAACQKFKREIILLSFFDINSALFSVPLM